MSSSSSSSNSSASSSEEVPNVTGQIGDLISITGNGLISATKILFKDSPANFEILSDSFLSVRVPTGAAYGKIKVISELVDPPITGETPYLFFPFPIIDYLSSYEGHWGDSIDVYGDALEGITGVKLNTLDCLFSIEDNNNLSFIVPSGNTNGPLNLLCRENLSVISDFNFSPKITITGFSSPSFRVGDLLIISGKYFLGELSTLVPEPSPVPVPPGPLLPLPAPVTSQIFEVVFFGENLLGELGLFEAIDVLTLSGVIPMGAKSGEISILHH